MINHYPRKNRIVCENKINRSSNTNGLKLRRRLDSVTCSRPCSRIYTRVYNKIFQRLSDKFIVKENDSSESPKDKVNMENK